MSHASADNDNHDVHEITYGSYITGFVLALILTLIPFGLVAFGWLSTGATLLVIGAAAVLQIIVHLFFFLHLDFSPANRWNTMSALFSAAIMILLIGGTLWLFVSLKLRMMLGS